MVKILDCTTRDTGYCTNWTYSDEEIINLFGVLNSNNVDYYEIGYRNFSDTENKGPFYRCDKILLDKFYPHKNNLKLGVMVDIKRISLDDFVGNSQDSVDFVRIATHPDDISKTLDVAEILHSRGYKIFIQLMEVNNLDTQNYIDLYTWQNKDILESLYFADTYGVLTPQQVQYYYTKLEILGYKKISFHAHNKNNNALDNTIKAIELGAYSVDVSQTHEGRNGGNLVMKDLLEYLK